jgi:hypothetical protein
VPREKPFKRLSIFRNPRPVPYGARGFTELEFSLLVTAGLLIAGILAHFVFDQSVQVQRLNALVNRDSVRLSIEENLNNIEVIKKSVAALAEGPENESLKACLLLSKNTCPTCCESRARRAVPIFPLGDDAPPLTGTAQNSSCIGNDGQPNPIGTESSTCFATARVSLEPVCPQSAANCARAAALLIHYQIQFLSPFLKDDPDTAVLERTLSLATFDSDPP